MCVCVCNVYIEVYHERGMGHDSYLMYVCVCIYVHTCICVYIIYTYIHVCVCVCNVYIEMDHERGVGHDSYVEGGAG